MIKKDIKLLYELSHSEKSCYKLPYTEIVHDYVEESLPKQWLRDELFLPNVSETEVARHFYNLSMLNYGVENGMYPLGSCTMKYNPKMNELIAQFDGFQKTHPLQADNTVSGNLFLLFDLEDMLCEITAMDAFTLAPAAGAHGELAGILLIRKYFQDKGEIDTRTVILIPESAHGTNPASAVAAGFTVEEIKSTETGEVDLDSLRSKLNDNVAGIMLTNPNTTGMFESNIKEIAALLHENGSLLYYDGANLNAILGLARPGDMGFDIVHLNIHKTFSTPHGGGGPGAGPVGVKDHLIPYLPEPLIGIEDDLIETSDMDIEEKLYRVNRMDQSIGRMRLTDTSFSVLVKAYAYILTLGEEYIHEVAESAVLNANYIKAMLKAYIYSPISAPCMHECVLSASKLENDITALDISKRLMDYGFHPPTNYFPLIIPEALMIEPTETETKEEMDRFIEVMKMIVKESKENPELLKNAPVHTPIRRTDDAKAARDLNVAFRKNVN
jgi:glycine dehydrogenase subunit 2